MLRRKELLDFIGFKLAHLKACVATLNEIHFFDLNVAAEDFFADLLNAVYGYSLVNLNHDNLNQVAVDLGDSARRVAVQVTSERTKPKVQKTIDKFAENGLADKYDTLKVLIIGDRTGDYPTLAVPPGITFSGKDDVIDIGRLMKDINQLGTTDLQGIADLIHREVKDELSESHAGSPDISHAPALYFENTQIIGGKGGVGPGGDARIKGTKGGDVRIVGGTIKGGDGGDGGGKGGDAIVEGGDG